MNYKLTGAAMDAFLHRLQADIEMYDKMKKSNMLQHEDAIIKACLEEMFVMLSKRAVERRAQYSFEIKPSWAFALLLQYQGFTDTTHAGITLHNMCCKIDQHFA